MHAPDGEPAFVGGSEPDEDEGWRPPQKPARPWLIVAFAASVVGVLFAAVSTHDFIQHLDRQVHSIHCSFVPGAGGVVGDSGCRAVMLSPYSSFFRESFWGGIPVSLWAMAVFAFLSYRSGVLAYRGSARRDEATFLLAATGLPVVMALAYGFLSVVKVGATCKVCVGIYAASAAAFLGAWIAWQRTPADKDEGYAPKPHPRWFAEGVGFVAVLTVAFLLFTPSSDAKGANRECGTLVRGDDPSGVMIALSDRGRVEGIEVLDPLCPACRAFDARLEASDVGDDLKLKGVLFPLDATCNWMVTERLHPGACLVSEAVLCAQGLGAQKDSVAARQVLAWAFEHQESLRALAEKDEGALRRRVEEAFPKVKGCVGGHAVKNKLTKSLRWAVANAIPVLTPQLFVGERRVCDEDTDLGLEYTLARMMRQGAGQKEARR